MRRLRRPSHRVLLAWLKATALLVLVAFHARLFWAQASTGALLDTSVAVRWTVGALALAGFAGLRRAGVSPFRGRRAVALWLLVGMLHWSAVTASPGATPGADGSGRVLSFILEFSALSAAPVLLLVFIRLAARRARRRLTTLAGTWRRVTLAAAGSPLDGFVDLLGARAPPRS